MTGREIVNLINKLQEKGISDTEIINIIKYIELTDPAHVQQETATDDE